MYVIHQSRKEQKEGDKKMWKFARIMLISVMSLFLFIVFLAIALPGGADRKTAEQATDPELEQNLQNLREWADQEEKAKKEGKAEEDSMKSKGIPGLFAVDVYGIFTNKGFTLTEHSSVEQQELWTVRQKTKEYLFEVGILGTSASNITSVEATALNFSAMDTGEIVKNFFGYVATLPYDGAKPSEAREWVQSNINKTCHAVFGPVKFELIANSPRARMLLLSAIAD